MKKCNIQLVPLALLIILCTLSFSCKKYVDIKTSSSQTFIGTAKDCQLLLDDYTTMNTGYPSDGEVSADDYYLTDAGYLMTALTSTDRDLYIWARGAIRPLALPQWQSSYKTIYQANLVMENVEKLKGTTDQMTLDALYGAALFFRAYGFWQIAQLYAKPYNTATANQDPGIPLRLSSDINGKSERGTVEQTYTQIIKDLQEALGLLPVTSIISSRPNKVAVYAMLARVYLSMEDYTQALSNASSALQLNSQLLDYNIINKTAVPAFSRFNKEVIFQSVMTPGPNLNPSSATANVAKIDPSIVASYATNDLRSQLFIKANSGVNSGSFRFTGNYEPVTSAVLFNGLAVDEIYLVRAECYARAGNIVSAMADLNTLLSTRWVTGTYTNLTASTADEALGIVLTERRKELLMRGLRWTDLRRLNKDIRFAKTLNRIVSGTTYILPPNDSRYTLLIPDEVISNSGISQNIR